MHKDRVPRRQADKQPAAATHSQHGRTAQKQNRNNTINSSKADQRIETMRSRMGQAHQQLGTLHHHHLLVLADFQRLAQVLPLRVVLK